MRLLPVTLALVTPAIAGLMLPDLVKDYQVPPDTVSTAEFTVDFPFSTATAASLTVRKFNCARPARRAMKLRPLPKLPFPGKTKGIRFHLG